MQLKAPQAKEEPAEHPARPLALAALGIHALVELVHGLGHQTPVACLYTSAIRAAVRRQENSRARNTLCSRRAARRAPSRARRVSPARMAWTSRGSTSSAAPPATSAMAP